MKLKKKHTINVPWNSFLSQLYGCESDEFNEIWSSAWWLEMNSLEDAVKLFSVVWFTMQIWEFQENLFYFRLIQNRFMLD